MADNWKNDILPGNDSLDLGSIAYDDKTPLEDITKKYTNLGGQINDMTMAAAKDVGTRQTRLIGNDFGAVDPMMYATYYQPNITGALSDIRVTGTEKALNEGMERGKAAAEANLAAAKNAYNSAMDGYNNAKQAFSNLQVAMTDSSQLPDGVNESEAISVNDIITSTSLNSALNKGLDWYDNQTNVDWSDTNVWNHAASKTIQESGKDTSAWKEEDWKNFWNDPNISIQFRYNYETKWLEDHVGADAKARYIESFNLVKTRVEQIYNYAKGISDKLPDFSTTEIFTLDGALEKAAAKKDFEILATETFDEFFKNSAKFDEQYIRDTVPVEDYGRIMTLYKKAKDAENAFYTTMASGAQTLPINEYLKTVWSPFLAEYNAIKTKSEYKADVIESRIDLDTAKKERSNLSKDMFGFDIQDLAWMVTWRKSNPEEYTRYLNQLAMSYGRTDALEIADGQKWYLTADGYVQLPKGTPVLFAPEGILDEDGKIRKGSKLQEFVDLWKDYYNADINSLSDKELTDKKTAIQNAYLEYMKEISACAMVNSIFNVRITGDVYNAVLASLNDPGTSDAEINGQKISDYIKEFKKLSEKDGDAALRYLYALTNAAYSKSSGFMRYNNAANQIMMESLQYDDGTSADGKNKLGQRSVLGIPGDTAGPNWDIEDNTSAVAMFLAITRSMEKFNAGSTKNNVDPKFMRGNAIGNIVNKVGSMVAGAFSAGAALVNAVSGTFAAPFNGWKNPLENGGQLSASNVFGTLFGADRKYEDIKYEGDFGERLAHNIGAVPSQIQFNYELDRKAREYAKNLVNPLLVDVYFGDTDIRDVRGVSDYWTLEGRGIFDTPYAFANFVTDMGSMMLVNYVEGATYGLVFEAIGKMASRANLIMYPKILELRAVNKGLDTVAHGLDWIDNIDDPYLADTTLRNTYITSGDIAAEDARAATAFVNKSTPIGVMPYSDGTKPVGALYGLTRHADDISDVKEAWGMLNRRSAQALSSVSIDGSTIDDLMEIYGESTRTLTRFMDKLSEVNTTGYGSAVADTIHKYQMMQSFPKVVLKSGEVVSMADASMVVNANRIFGVHTLSLATGINPIEIAYIPDAPRNFLLKALNKMTKDNYGQVTNGTIEMFLKSAGPDDFKNMTRTFIERAKYNMAIGKAWDKFDNYRALAAAGWGKSGSYALTREFLVDAITDPLRDFKRNVENPQLDDKGNMRVQTIGEYFTDPGNIFRNLVWSSFHFGFSRLRNQIGGWRWNQKRLDAENAFAAYMSTGDPESPEAKRLVDNIVKATNKAQKYSDRAWKVGMSYDKVVRNTTASNALIDQNLATFFRAQGWEIDYGGLKRFNSSKEYFDFMTNKKMPTAEGQAALMNAVTLKAMNNFYLVKLQMGVGVNEFGNLSRGTYLKIFDTMRKTFNDNYKKVSAESKDTLANIHTLYGMMKADLLKANSDNAFGFKIKNFEKSLDSYFFNLEEYAKAGLKSGFLPKVRYGYLPISSLYFDGSFDDMMESHRNAATRGLLIEGRMVDVSAANPSQPRNAITLDSILDAMLKGEQTYDVVDKNGKVIRTVTLDYNGLNPIDNTITYMNNYNLHKYLDPLWGENVSNYSQALKNGNAYIIGNGKMRAEQWNNELTRAKHAITGYWKTEKGKKIYTAGEIDKIAEKAVAKKIIDESQVESLKKNWSVEAKMGKRAYNKLQKANKKLSDAKALVDKNASVINDGDVPNSTYPLFASVFGDTNAKGVGDADKGRAHWERGQKIAKKLLKEYTNGNIAEDMKVYDLTTKSGKQTLHRSLPVDNTLISLLSKAAESNGTITSDLVSWAAIYSDVITPYVSKTVEGGVTTIEPVSGYKSSLKNKYNPEPEVVAEEDKPSRFYEVSTAGDARFSAFNAKLPEGYIRRGLNLGGKTIEEAWQKDIKMSGKGQAPAKNSPVYMEPEPVKPEDYGTTNYINRAHTVEDDLYERYVARNRLQELEAQKKRWTKNGYKDDLGHDVREREKASETGNPIPGTSKLEKMDAEIKAQKSFIKQFNKRIGNNDQIYTKKRDLPLEKIISGGSTGADTIGLEVGRMIGVETGGTASPKFYREPGFDKYTAKDMEAFGLTEINPKTQGKKRGKDFFLPTTEENVKNSDGTVYFADNIKSPGKKSTEDFAKKYNKPFLLNPTSEELYEWIKNNDIKTLNVAGNRAKYLKRPNTTVKDVLIDALSDGGKPYTKAENFSFNEYYKPMYKAFLEANPELAKDLAEKSAGKVLTDEFATTGVNQARALNELLVEMGLKDPRDLEFNRLEEERRKFAVQLTGDPEGKIPFGVMDADEQVSNIKTYSGLIEPDADTIFVFGSNPDGRHGLGAAKAAVEKFGAVYGQGEGLQGNSYAIPTKNLPPKKLKAKLSGLMTYEYKGDAYKGVTDKTTFDAIISGKRTSTTRLMSQAGEYWKKAKVGDIIEFKSDKNGTRKLYVEVTKKPTMIDPRTMSKTELDKLLKKEGWSKKGFDEAVTKKLKKGEKAVQFEYKLLQVDDGKTKKTGKKSISPEQITNSIKTMYSVAESMPEKKFKVAYSDDKNLNGYSLQEMADMFKAAGKAPDNVYFSTSMAKKLLGRKSDAYPEKGISSVDVVKIYGSTYRLSRNESGDVIVSSSEAKMAELEKITEDQLYRALNADYDAKKKEWSPNAFQKRYVESVIDRAKVEFGDQGLAFDGNEWVNKIDRIDADRKLANIWCEEFVDDSGWENSIASFVKGLEKDNSIDEFKLYLSRLAADAGAGKLTHKLPDDVTSEDVIRAAYSVLDLLDSSENYNNRPKRSQEQVTNVDEEGNEMEDINSPSNTFVDRNGELVGEYGYGETDEELPIYTRVMDLSSDNVEFALRSFQNIIKWGWNPENPMYKIAHSKTLADIHQERIDAYNNVKALATRLNNEAEKLYNRKKNQNKDFNALVNRSVEDAKARTINFGGAGSEYQFLEALGVAAPDAGLNSIGSGSMGQTNRRYNAAMLEISTGVPNTEERGWSIDITRARVEAGRSYSAHLEQIAKGFELLQEYSGKDYSAIIRKIRGEVDEKGNIIKAGLITKLSDRFKSQRSDFSDNVENSAMALLADVYDDARAVKVMTQNEIDFNVKRTTKTINNFASNMFDIGDIAAKPNWADDIETANMFGNIFGELSRSYYEYKNAIDEYDAAAYPKATQLSTDETGSKTPQVDKVKLAELDKKAEMLSNNFDAVVRDVYARFGGGQFEKTEEYNNFKAKIIDNMESINTLSEFVTETFNNVATVKGWGTDIPYSMRTGKQSMFTQKQLSISMTDAKALRDGGVIDDISFNVKRSEDGSDLRINLHKEYGTGSEAGESGVTIVFYSDNGKEINPSNIKRGKDNFMSAAAQALEDNNDDGKIIKINSEFADSAGGELTNIRGEVIAKRGEVLIGFDDEGKPIRLSGEELTTYRRDLKEKLDAREKEVKELVKEARQYGDLSENEEYRAAMAELESLQKQYDETSPNYNLKINTVRLNEAYDFEKANKERAKGKTPSPQYDKNGNEIKPVIEYNTTGGGSFNDYEILQSFGDGWYYVTKESVGIEKEPIRSFRGTKKYSESEIAELAMSDWAEKTKDYKPEKEIEKAKKNSEKAQAAYDKAKKELKAIKKEVGKEELSLDELAKRVYSQEEYISFRKKMDAYETLKESNPKDKDFYQVLTNGVMIVDGKVPVNSGCSTIETLLKMYGYDMKKFKSDISEGRVYTEKEIKKDLEDRKAMMKEINKNLRSGNVKKTRTQDFKAPSALDLKSRTMTINNLLAMAKQCTDLTGIKDLDASMIVVSKDYSDMLARYSREGIGPETFKQKAKGFALKVNEWNQFIQQTQLAGGISYVNALTIAQTRAAILSSPLKMYQYIKLATDYKNDASVLNFAVENSNRLVKIGMKVQDPTVFTDFQASASSAPGLQDNGTVASFAYKTQQAWENRKKGNRNGVEKYDFFTDSVQNSVDSLFGDATFQRMLPVLRAKMLMMNYDNAARLIRKKFPNLDAESVDDAACKFSYAKTMAFFDPSFTTSGFMKTRGIDQVLDTIADRKLRDSVAMWTGAKDEPSIGQMASNCFFALSYKNRMIQPIVQGARSLLSPGENKQRLSLFGKKFDDETATISSNTNLRNLGTQFMQRGNRTMVGSLALISALAFLNAKALGLSTSWDDLSFTDENDLDENGNPTFKVPEILKKFQTIGQIWIPNAVDENGNPTINPRKPAFMIDTMSSMFTLPNTAWKTIDRAFNQNDYYTSPQRGIGLLGQMTGINPQGINDVLNWAPLRAVGDELIASNLISPYKAIYEIVMDSTYYGNNIWEKRYLPDGSVNKNYDPARNIKASLFHFLGFDELLDPKGYNRWVKGYYTDDYVEQDQIGTVSGSGVFQHEYVTLLKDFLKGDIIEGIVEGGELPIKKKNLSSSARTEFNVKVKNIIAQYMSEYKDKIANTTNVDIKDEAYADTVKKCADAVADWSSRHEYALGKDQSLVPYVTRMMMAMLAGEYDDNLDYVQNTYWKASQIAQIEASGPDEFWLRDNDIEEWVKSGKTAEEFAAEKNKRTNAYNEALDEEYRARKALHEAGIDNEYLAGMSYENIKAEQRLLNKEVYTQALWKLDSPVGEFKNFKEMKAYYEAQIDAASSTKSKAKLAKQYNRYVTDALAPFVEKYGAAIISDGKYNGEYLSNALADYIIIPADQYYSGKNPKSNYLKDLFHVGYHDKSALPSDNEVIEAYALAKKQMYAGYTASAIAILDTAIDAIKRGRMYVSDSDYSKLIRMKALLSARSK